MYVCVFDAECNGINGAYDWIWFKVDNWSKF